MSPAYSWILLFQIQSDSLLLIGMFRPVTFNVIIYNVDLSLLPCCLFSVCCICFFFLFSPFSAFFGLIGYFHDFVFSLLPPCQWFWSSVISRALAHNFQLPKPLWAPGSVSVTLCFWGMLCVEPLILLLGPECALRQKSRVAVEPCLFPFSQEPQFCIGFKGQ